MGLLDLLTCRRRRPPTAAACPISGKQGVCPISGQKSAPPAGASEARAAELKERGSAHFRKAEFQAALETYNEALLLTPRDAALWLNRSLANRRLQNWEDARDDAEISAGLQPGNAKAHYSWALALQELGEQRQALKVCEEGLAVHPGNKALAQLRVDLKRATSSSGEAKRAARAAPLLGNEAKRPIQAALSGGAEAKRAPRAAPPPLGNEAKRPIQAALSGEAEADTCPGSQLSLQEASARASQEVYQWKGALPSPQEREGLKSAMVGMFRGKYLELRAAKRLSTVTSSNYSKEQKQGLQLKGGHRPMERPEHVDLPADFRQPLGVISLEELGEFGSSNQEGRYVLSVYGELFDVSDRPDKYGPEGPYASLTGKDLTWGLFAGVDTEDYCNRCYDLFKARDLGKDKLAGLCSWLAWYQTEYGEPVGRLEPYTHEEDLPAPPLEELNEACAVM